MFDQEFDRFDVRAITPRELAQHLSHARNMLVAATAASLSILGASAFFVSLWL
ncbi:hypothetical protein PRN20_07280 [Devosia sp. ZB163]|uniref:hypothetical protein n=1 Tax=Devosia sp. ZB163 TaxID=3025938 RepID=UPI0023625C4C|nr:hypothetical protein [Devosia sp. ZB163]MDC9823529.1 hypothetical protein [Devosia sp. ZB163]